MREHAVTGAAFAAARPRRSAAGPAVAHETRSLENATNENVRSAFPRTCPRGRTFPRAATLTLPGPFLYIVRMLPTLSSLDIDGWVARWFDGRMTHEAARYFHWLSAPGSAVWIGVVLALALLAMAWLRRWRMVAAVLLTVPCGMVAAELIKLLCGRVRPRTAGTFVDWTGYSFPSGHTTGATLLYGLAALLLAPLLPRGFWRVLAVVCAAILIGGVALGRVALGAHYVSDVLAAIVLAIIWLWICRRVVRVPATRSA